MAHDGQVLGPVVGEEVLTRGDGEQVARVLALQAAHELLRQPPAQVRVLAVRLLRRTQAHTMQIVRFGVLIAPNQIQMSIHAQWRSCRVNGLIRLHETDNEINKRRLL